MLNPISATQRDKLNINQHLKGFIKVASNPLAEVVAKDLEKLG